MITEDFANAALGFLGTRYKHQGRLPGLGLDCAGVVVCAARAVGVDVEDVTGYAPRPSGLQLVAALRAHCAEVHDEPERGDILVFSWGGDEPQHLAVFVGEGQIVHAYSAARKCVQHGMDAAWRERITNIFRIK